jgi:Arm DNA-binding domain
MGQVLTQKTIDNLKPTSQRREVPDGALPGLFFIIQPSGAKSWAFRYRVNGKSRKWTIGGYPALSLKEARERTKKGLGHDASRGKESRQAGRASAPERRPDRHLAKYAKARRPRSVQEITRIVEREIVPAWKGRIITDIRKKDVHAL